MTYQQYSAIQASTYNAFSAITNSIYADTNAGTTSYTSASYGYGQTALSTSIASGAKVQAAEWAALFSDISKCGNHQGTTVVPPLPGVGPGWPAPVTGSTTLPVAGSAITAYNSPAGALTTLLNTLITNRFNLYAGQTSVVNMPSTPFAAPSWTHTLTYTFTATFSDWDHARYFFNAGGAIYISGAHPGVSGDDAEWNGMLTSMSPLVFNYGATTPNTGTPGSIGGFWNTGTTNPLTSAYQTIYTQTYALSPYSGSYIQVNAKLGAAAGSAGTTVITFQVVFFQADSGTLFAAKTGTTMTPAYRNSAGAVPTTAPVLASLGFVAT